jgi:hypothetical protein
MQLHNTTLKNSLLLTAIGTSTTLSTATVSASTDAGAIHQLHAADFAFSVEQTPGQKQILLFLSDSLKLSPQHVNELLKLRIRSGKEETVQIVGHLKEQPCRESIDSACLEQTLDSDQIIYHFANTEPGGGESPIISEDLHIIGTHTRGAVADTKGANSEVRMRNELLPFIEYSIKTHQAFLERLEANAAKLEALRAKKKQEAEQALVDKGKDEGKKAAKIAIARKMLAWKRPLDEIIEDTNLSVDEIKAIK